MTTKTIKTILFAALIAVMVLPFGGMQSAFATHVEDHDGERTGEYTGEQKGEYGQPTDDDDPVAVKLATLERTLAFVEGELVNCRDPEVLASLEALKLILIDAIAEINERYS